jgi:signal transduction histidine kinase
MKMPLLTVSLETELDVVAARQRARQIARELGFEQQDQTRIATAVSEIARNAVSYGRNGRVEFALSDDKQLLRVAVKDRGDGIPDLPAVLEGRYRSSTGLGKGILGTRRLMDFFSIESDSQGTAVIFGKNLPRHARIGRAELARLADVLAQHRSNPLQELREQNRELMASLSELQARTGELHQLTNELEHTNRGVVALHAELEATAAELRKVSDLKTRFLSNMSHEFRTPLNSILALSRLLLDRTDGDLSADQEKQVQLIAKAAQSLTELVNDLLDIAKVESGKVDVNATRFTVADLFAALRGLLRPLKASDSVELAFEEPVGLPILFTDEAKITQILRNFISNALKFTERGEVHVSAEFHEPDRVVFCVRDTGIGIPKEFHDRIFEEFEQVPGPMQLTRKGTGLGLPLSRKLAELLHGKVAVDSMPGAGSSFFLDVPVSWRTEGTDATPVEAERTDDRPRILIADDEEAFRYVMRRMVDPSKYEIIEAGDGASALTIAESALPDVIILDINMPERDGYSVLHELGQNPATRTIPVIVSSSLVLSERDRGRLARSFKVLSKGELSSELLGSVLSEALQAARASP